MIDIQDTAEICPAIPLKPYGLPTYNTAHDAIAAYDGDDHFYALYPRQVEKAARRFVGKFPGEILYAVKANPHPSLLTILWNEGVTRFDVASIREMDLINGLFPRAKMYLMHPVKSRAAIARAYQLGIRDFAFDHGDELEKIIACTNGVKDLHLHLRVALPKGGAAMPLYGKFGAESNLAIELLQSARSLAAKLGISFHVGSQCMNAQDYDTAIFHARALVDMAGIDIDSINLGGGYPVSYPELPAPPLESYFQVIQRSLAANRFDMITVLGEPGRALCAEGGATLARVELRKGGDLYLNDGTYGSLFDAGQFAWKFCVKLHRSTPRPIEAAGPGDAGVTNFRLFGPTCDSVDVMKGPFYLPADVREGDWIEFQNLGAYGQALAAQFNGFFSTHTVALLDDTL